MIGALAVIALLVVIEVAELFLIVAVAIAGRLIMRRRRNARVLDLTPLVDRMRGK